MPIIKDKYAGKGSQTRSRFLTRSKDRAVTESAPVGLTTEQKRELEKESYRANPSNKTQVSTTTPTSISQGITTPPEEKIGNITGYNFVEANKAILLFTLNIGDTLNNIYITNANVDAAASVVSLNWSSGDQTNIDFEVASGRINATSGAISTSLFSANMPYGASANLGEVLRTIFKNVQKDIYFYVATQTVGVSITYSITNE